MSNSSNNGEFNIPSIGSIGSPVNHLEEDFVILLETQRRREIAAMGSVTGNFCNSTMATNAGGYYIGGTGSFLCGPTPHSFMQPVTVPPQTVMYPEFMGGPWQQTSNCQPQFPGLTSPVWNSSPIPASPVHSPGYIPPHSLMRPCIPQNQTQPTIGMLNTPPHGGIQQAGSTGNQGPGDPVPLLVNVVSTINLQCKLGHDGLRKIAQRARNAEFNPKRFGAVIMRIREPRTTGLIFHSGKMVCTGAKTVADSRLAARKFARIIQKIGFEVKFTDFVVQNMVASCDVDFQIRLEVLSIKHHKFTSYEPELFPGLVYRMVKPRLAVLVFGSGKVVLTGAKKAGDIQEGFVNLYPILKAFKKSQFDMPL